jgi:DNA-binding SARP family transcriptional activator
LLTRPARRGSRSSGILAPLQVLRAGCVVPLGGSRQRAVLALLLLEANRVVSKDRLAEEVWAGHPPEGATTLQTYVFHLRRAFPDQTRRSRTYGPRNSATLMKVG